MNVKDYMEQLGRAARQAARQVASASTAAKNTALLAMAASVRKQRDELLAANARDLD